MIKTTQAFVYKWTELSTGKWYIGSRAKYGCHPRDGYICSSKVVKKLIKDKPTNWYRDIFLMAEPNDARSYESELLIGLDAKKDPMSYNLHNGDGKFSTRGMNPWNKGTKGLQIAWNKGLPTERQPGYQKSPTEEIRKILSEQKQGNKNPRYGKVPWNTGLKLGPQPPELISKRTSWQKGTKRPAEVGQKISETKKKNNAINPVKSWDEQFDQKYIEVRKEKLAKRFKENNPNSKNKGKSWDEIMGPERAQERRNKLSNPLKPRKKRCDIGLSRKKNIGAS